MTDHKMPWGPAPMGEGSAYVTDGPETPINFTVAGVDFHVEPTNQTGIDSGRTRFLAVCLTCGERLHEATTGPRCVINSHLRHRHEPGAPLGEKWQLSPLYQKLVDEARDFVKRASPNSDVLDILMIALDALTHRPVYEGKLTEYGKREKRVREYREKLHTNLKALGWHNEEKVVVWQMLQMLDEALDGK